MTSSRRAVLLLGLVVVLVLAALFVESARGTTPAERAQVRGVICSVFGPYCHSAVRVALCETGGTLWVAARGSAGERGLFQIHPVHFGWLDERRLFEARYNARAAFILSRGGRDWGPWTCQP